MSENPFFSAFFEGFRPARQRERAALTIYRALEARQADHMPVGGVSADSRTPPPRTPRTQRRTSARKPSKSRDADGDSDGPARRHAPIFYGLRDVADVLTLSPSGIQAMVRAGEFPKPRALGARRVGWLVSEVVQWAESREVADMLPPMNAGNRRARQASQPSL
ncbi:AlpA family phage regulatory protein [Paraburkholderia sp. SEWSISQ10-3 4]|uniref:helix-turn-helix transcriptional regulator n=1 Tax=Paraburkholderia TaxID=1822464 RepID=UPI00225334A7|nr:MULTISPECIES: AlpA family phage regulatory protein [Paraburkholderia]MCX4137881.1 AlpA family phage regulatory protein [Paraburkholderia aspalathi]MDN7170572.1 AlpA family phage regulatory protein [Paraburkholderia sp. SEWSISQ10-3 4]MDQ6500211.1 AlpA family phage regulatory protein [Paraburkholderia aspalathi]